MGRATRNLLLLAAGAVALASATGLAFLRLGRPVAYGDGARVAWATELADASMLAWGSPAPFAALPGPVEGPARPLPDGRWIYGRLGDDGRADLALFDPARADAGAIPVFGADGAAQDLSPAWIDGRVVFSSDRAGGAGGFDLWSGVLEGASLRDVVRLPDAPDGPNTPADEADPASDPYGGLVFMRRDPTRFGGRDGRLWRWDGASAPRLVFEGVFGEAGDGVVDRDPALSPDGLALWFVRAAPGRSPEVRRAYRHAGRFGASRAVPEVSLGGRVRGPAVAERGFALYLLEPSPTPMLRRAEAYELYPYPEGAAALERLLWTALLAALLLVALLLLGRRFRKLDVITWCLLVSLLLHLLAVWLLRDVLIERSLRAEPGEGRMAVDFVASAGAAGGGGGATEAPSHDATAFAPSAAARFQGHDAPLEVAADANGGPPSPERATETAGLAAPTPERRERAAATPEAAAL
ncbi:MAG TPA: hypothetical protein VEI02_11745, partial [Planctomycetota bacterium]|nr:hypothetical protein [Planctomycetota bacterium]